MTAVYRFELEKGGAVLAEIQEEPRVARTSRKDAILQDTRLSFEKALTGVRDAASAALEQFRAIPHRPDEIELKFGVKLDAKAGAVIAQTGMEGHIEVRLTWGTGAVWGGSAAGAGSSPRPGD